MALFCTMICLFYSIQINTSRVTGTVGEVLSHSHHDHQTSQVNVTCHPRNSYYALKMLLHFFRDFHSTLVAYSTFMDQSSHGSEARERRVGKQNVPLQPEIDLPDTFSISRILLRLSIFRYATLYIRISNKRTRPILFGNVSIISLHSSFYRTFTTFISSQNYRWRYSSWLTSLLWFLCTIEKVLPRKKKWLDGSVLV